VRIASAAYFILFSTVALVGTPAQIRATAPVEAGVTSAKSELGAARIDAAANAAKIDSEHFESSQLAKRPRYPFLPRQCLDSQNTRGVGMPLCNDTPRPAASDKSPWRDEQECCEYPAQSRIPTYLTLPDQPAPRSFGSSTQGFNSAGKTIHNLPITYGVQSGCPPLGIALDRNSTMTLPFLRAVVPVLDRVCRQPPHVAVRGFNSVLFHSCSFDPRGKNYGLVAWADVSCAP
jgi:hypothetical protein